MKDAGSRAATGSKGSCVYVSSVSMIKEKAAAGEEMRNDLRALY